MDGPIDRPEVGMAAESVTVAMSAVALAVSSALGPVVQIDGQSDVTVVQSQVVQVACDGPTCPSVVDVGDGVQAFTGSLQLFLADLARTADQPAPWDFARHVGLRIVLMHF
jgi:hypothetical protein